MFYLNYHLVLRLGFTVTRSSSSNHGYKWEFCICNSKL